MLTRSVPKLLQEAKEVKEALEQIGDELPEAISVAKLDHGFLIKNLRSSA